MAVLFTWTWVRIAGNRASMMVTRPRALPRARLSASNKTRDRHQALPAARSHRWLRGDPGCGAAPSRENGYFHVLDARTGQYCGGAPRRGGGRGGAAASGGGGG